MNKQIKYDNNNLTHVFSVIIDIIIILVIILLIVFLISYFSDQHIRPNVTIKNDDFVLDDVSNNLDYKCKDNILFVYSNRNIDKGLQKCKIDSIKDAYNWLICNKPNICQNTSEDDIDCTNLQCLPDYDTEKIEMKIESMDNLSKDLSKDLPEDITDQCKDFSNYVYDKRDTNKRYKQCDIKTAHDAYLWMTCYEPQICSPKYELNQDCKKLDCRSNTEFSYGLNLIGTNIEGNKYDLQDLYVYDDFLNKFTFKTGVDPNNGLVLYMNQLSALVQKLFTYENSVKLGKLYKQTKIKIGSGFILNSDLRGTVKLQSNKAYNGGLFILDVEHVPGGLTVWPYFYLAGKNWPCNGEIDIMESVNSIDWLTSVNFATLHTDQKCTQDQIIGISNGGNCGNGRTDKTCSPCTNIESKDCAYTGCSVSLGPGTNGLHFNKNGGGIYVCDWELDGKIKIWVFSRDISSKYVPFDASTIDTSLWPKPHVEFKPCVGSFKDCHIVLGTTVCGDWAGTDYLDREFGTCRDFATDPNNRYEEAYWKINYIKVFNKTN